MNQFPCPGCGTTIHVDVQRLLAGVAFACSGCAAEVALAPASVPTVHRAVDKLDEQRSRDGERGAMSGMK